MDYSVENIGGLMIRSKLLSAEQVRSLYARWQKEGKDHLGSTPHYLKWIVANHYLTEYQAALIARGLADSFFLGQYKVLDRLGKGRMAGVYEAVHNLGQVVAIKVLPPSRAKDPQMLARFQREAKLAMKLKHPNVVRSFQVGEADGLHYLVMEHLDGETLEEVLSRRKKLPYNEAARLVHQALLGLQHIQEKGMVHRDIKPANLMLVPAAGGSDTTLNATVKILDIGLGRELFDESTQAAMKNLELTGEGALLGTPDYLAPEQARDPRTIDIRADIYGMGCVLYHCLAGRPPFPDTNIVNQMVRHATEAPRPIRELAPDVPEGLQQVLKVMLAKKPDQRHATPEAAAQALKPFLVAGASVKSIEEAPQMRRYLTWLETAAPKGERPEVKTPIPAGDARSDRRRAREEKRRSKHDRKHKHRSRNGNDLPVAAPVRPGDFDVELVPLPSATAAPSPAGPRKPLLTLTVRDWILIGGGSGAVIFAVLMGFLLAKLFGG
jgi:serine/threonine protein kinase